MDRSEYIINIAGLKTGSHQYDLSANADLFEELNPELFEDGLLQVTLILQKSESMIEAKVNITGEVTLVCDRSLKLFQEPFNVQERIFFKFGEEEKELSEDVMVIPFQQQSLDFLQFIYEFISINLPVKRLHPDYRDDEAGEWIYYSEGTGEELSDDTEEEENTAVDPRWEALKQLKSK